ncbi:MAG: LytTR family DNA-binding domain-containing protein [Bacteroidales bacterium]
MWPMLGAGAINFVLTSLFLFLVPPVDSSLKSSRWTLGKSILFILALLLLISWCNYLYSVRLLPEAFRVSLAKRDLDPFGSWIYMTFAVGIFPVLAVLVLVEKRLDRRNRDEAKRLGQTTRNLRSDVPENPLLTLSFGTGDTMSFRRDDFLCLQAEGGNYARLYLEESGEVRSRLLRIALNSFLEQFPDHPALVRCHKSHVVNLHRVKTYQGNARSLYLRLEGLEMEIPVSRSFPRAILPLSTSSSH